MTTCRQIRLKYLAILNMGQSPSSESVSKYSEASMAFLQGNAEFGTRNPTPKHSCDEPAKVARKGDLLISVRAPIGALNVANMDYGIGRGLCGITWTKLDSRFGWWAMHHCRKQLDLVATGSTFAAVSREDVGNIRINSLSLTDHAAIADYLDRETARMDELVAEKKKMLELLEEKRNALITRAVTRGLDPKEKMKGSGIEWAMQVPRHWLLLQLKRVFRQIDYGISEDIRGTGSIKVLRMSNIQNGSVNVEGAGEIDHVDPSLLLKKDDLLFNRTNSLDQIAKVGLVREEPDEALTFASYLVRLRTNILARPKFLNYLLNSPLFRAFARGQALPAIGQANLNPSRLGEIYVCLPPVEEQDAIVEALDSELSEARELEQALKDSIALLTERRTALITAAVTGQIDVQLVNR